MLQTHCQPVRFVPGTARREWRGCWLFGSNQRNWFGILAQQHPGSACHIDQHRMRQVAEIVSVVAAVARGILHREHSRSLGANARKRPPKAAADGQAAMR